MQQHASLMDFFGLIRATRKHIEQCALLTWQGALTDSRAPERRKQTRESRWRRKSWSWRDEKQTGVADETYFNSLLEERADAIASAAARGNEAPALVEAGAIFAWTTSAEETKGGTAVER